MDSTHCKCCGEDDPADLGETAFCQACKPMPPAPTCDRDGCDRLLYDPRAATDRVHEHYCALHTIASYNWEELREWGDENAADMVRMARAQLTQEAMQ